MTNHLAAAVGGWWSEPPTMANAEGGRTSTIDDLWVFARMLGDLGRVDGVEVLLPRSLQAMTRNHLSDDQRATTSPQPPELYTDFWRGANGAIAT